MFPEGPESFLEGLEATLAELELALDAQPPEMLAAVSPLLTDVAAGFEECRELALHDPHSLPQAHARLSHDLLQLHEACWRGRGPTPVGWANRAVDAVERFLAGGPLTPELSRHLDARVAWLEGEGAHSLLVSLRPLADWARGSVSISHDELQQHLLDLIEAVQREASWLEQPRGLQALLESPDQELLERNLSEVARLQAIFRGLPGEQAADLETSLGELETRLARGDLDEAPRLAGELEARLQAFSLEGPETVVSCPACGCLNAHESRRCHFCSVLLVAPEGEPDEAEEEHVARLRSACYAFQEGRSGREELLEAVNGWRLRLEPARQAVTAAEAPRYHQALDDLEAALRALAQVEVRSDVSLNPSLELFLRGAEALRRAATAAS